MEMEKPLGSSSSLSSQSPSFAAYSSQNLGDIAARVVNELNFPHHDPYYDDFYSSLPQNNAIQDPPQNETNKPRNDDDGEESEFEFAVVCGAEDSSPISADEIFYNGQIKPIYPLFNTDLVFRNDAVLTAKDDPDTDPDPTTTIQLPLRKLLTDERENSTASCSSSEADDLDGVPPETYCVWTPKKKNNAQDDDVLMRKKSKSTGSNSKRWRIRDLLYRSNSDGKDTFVFLAPSHHQQHGGDSKGREKSPAPAPVKKRGSGLEGKTKFYLPRRDLVGFFANANGISRMVRPF